MNMDKNRGTGTPASDSSSTRGAYLNEGPREIDLRVFDLTYAEERTLLALLELGPSRVSRIGKAADIPRTTTYSVLLRLKDRGFVRQLSKGQITTWKVVRPDRLRSVVRSGLSTLEEETGTSDTSLSTSLGAIEAKNIGISAYQGIREIERGYEELLTLHKAERAYFIQGNQAAKNEFKLINKPYFIDFYERFKKAGIIMQSVSGEHILELFKGLDTTLLKSHLHRLLVSAVLPDKYMDFALEAIVFRETVLFISPEEELLLVVRNKEIVDMFNHICLFLQEAGKIVNLNKHIWNIIEEREKK